MYGECSGNFLHVQEFPAKCKKHFWHNLLMCRKNNYNFSCACQKYGDFAGTFPTCSFLPALFDKLPAHAVTRSVGRTRDSKALLRDSGTPLIFARQSRGMWDDWQVYAAG